MAAGDLHVGHMLLGALLGVGAVAAAPFTGGGSVLGAATLASSLSGLGTGLAAATAGTVGAAVADGMVLAPGCNNHFLPDKLNQF